MLKPFLKRENSYLFLIYQLVIFINYIIYLCGAERTFKSIHLYWLFNLTVFKTRIFGLLVDPPNFFIIDLIIIILFILKADTDTLFYAKMNSKWVF